MASFANVATRRSLARRVRPGDPLWPSAGSWERLKREVGGHLINVQSPLATCANEPKSTSCNEVLKQLRNPYYIGDEPALTQTSGWVDAWKSTPSAYALAASTTEDVVTAVNFSRDNNLRMVVKGGGHSYQGTSNSPDSLLIWTRAMNSVVLHDAFVAQGCAEKHAPQPAVTVGAGSIWGHVYDAVTTKAGRYVQGGGCTTVGVAGLVQSGGFGSFSKNYGVAAAGLIEAEVVTADGKVRIANACSNPDLFWGLKGGGGGNLGVITKLTLRTRELPEFFGGVFGAIKANSDAAFRELITRVISLYQDRLLNPHWGEQIVFEPDNSLRIAMVFQGLDQTQAESAWRPFLDWVAAAPRDFTVEMPARIVNVPARHFWNAGFLKQNLPEFILADSRPQAPGENFSWIGDSAEVGQFLHGYRSAWLPVSLLKKEQQAKLADSLFAASRHWGVALHFNKGLAGASAETISAAKDTAMNPAVLDAFALAIVAGAGPAEFAGMPGSARDQAAARHHAHAIDSAMDQLLKVVPDPGSYVSESDYFERNWKQSFWGSNYPKLAAVKKKYDPDGLFIVHHGVGSEEWSPDGFTRVT